MWIRSQPTANLISVHIGHHNIQQNKRWRFGLYLSQGLLPVFGLDHIQSFLMQDQPIEGANVWIVVYDKYFLHCTTSVSSWLRSIPRNLNSEAFLRRLIEHPELH